MPRRSTQTKSDLSGRTRITVELDSESRDCLESMLGMLKDHGKRASISAAVRCAIVQLHEVGDWSKIPGFDRV